MNSKTLLVFTCLLAAAQARPAAVPTSASCAVSCSGRNFWTGYESGTTLKYSFEQKVELSSGLSEQKSVLTQVTGKASVEVHGDCEMVLTVDVQGSKASKSPSEATNLEAKTLPGAMVEALKQPLRFSFQDGRIDVMCPSSSETRASLNFKRGLLSQLHLSIDRPDQEARVREEDVLGNCWTVYKQLGGNKVEKTKDLSSCTNNFEVFPRWGVKMEAPDRGSQWPTVVKGNLKCSIELESESMVIKENLCEEERVLGDGMGGKSAGEKVKVTTSLKLDQKLSSVASALFEVRDRSDLKHRHKTGDSCHDSKVWFEEDIFHSGNECLEKKLPTTGTASGDFKALAKSTIEELCEETKSNNMLNSTAVKYADLVKYMRGITSQEDFTGLFTWVKDGYCSDNAMLKVIVYSAIPSVGTRQSIQVILNQLKGSDGMSTDTSTSGWLASGIAMMPHPTPDIISDVLEFTKKSKEEAMLIVSKDQPLTLSAITGRYCTINTECENNEAVAAVLSFFSNALGTNCSSLESQEDPFTFDYAFTALLSIGNIGRAAGGAKSIIGCAENTKLSTANRAFALRALRRFPDLSKEEKMRLGDLIKSKDLDSELRIIAYQVVARYATLSFWSDERVISKLSDFMQDEREDQQVQRFIYSHLSQWMRKQKQSTDSYTVSNILREYEKNLMSKSSLSGLQVSSYWLKDFKEKSSNTKIELESNLIYSSKSMLPRFVNFNLTVENPSSAEAVNMFEFGVRMEGMESVMEQVFNILSRDSNPDELVRKRRQASLELTEEQQQYKQTPSKQRLDFFVRKGGMEMTHNNFDETILGVVPQLMKTTDFANVQGLAGEQMSSINLEKAGQLAGTALESTVSIPTISGFPILMKREIHYLTNIAFKQNFNMPSMMEMDMGLEMQPTVSVHMARTVTVDSGFERAGVKYRTSGLSSLGVKLSLMGKFDDPDNIQFSYKMEQLKKQQKILELKTDVVFVQHSGPSNVIESPVVSPSEMTPVTSKCFTPLTVKLMGRRMCLDTNFGKTNNPLSFVRQNPGSFRLYIDKEDAFGVYEATLQLKREGRNYNALVVLGDQSSPDRHVKFQFSLNRSADSRKIIVELANPVLPIKWVSERKTVSDGNYDITVDLKFGTTDYAFRGTKSKEETGGWKLDGNFFRTDKERQKLKVVTTFASYGLLKFLPLFKFDFAVTTPTNDKLTFNHLINYSSGSLDLSMLASHEMAGSVVTSVKSRLQCIRKQRGEDSQTRVILYDTEVVNKNGKNLQHSFSAKVDRKQKDASAETWESTLVVSHKFKYGVSKENSLLDIDASLTLDETIKRQQVYKAVGSGSVTYQTDSGAKTATLKNVRLVLGESDVIDDHFNTKTFLLDYATEMDGSQSEALVAVQILPIKMWRMDNQCVYFTMKTTKTIGTDSKTHHLELRHTSSRDDKFPGFSPVLLQSVKVIYASEVLLDATHKFYTVSYSTSERITGHFVNVTTYTGQTYFIGNRYSSKWEEPVSTTKISTTVKINEETALQVNHSLVQQERETQQIEYQLDYTKKMTSGAFKIYTQDFTYKTRRRAAMEIFSYLRSARSRGFEIKKFMPLVKNFFTNIKMESGMSMKTAGYDFDGSNYIDTTVMNGILLNVTRNTRDAEVSTKRSYVLYKELKSSSDRYRRAYKLDIQKDDVKKTYSSEVVYNYEPNPKLQVSLSKTSDDQSKNFNMTTVGEFIKDYQRERQYAVNWNVSVVYGNSMETSSKLKLVVDTERKRPALNVTLDVTSTTGQSLNVIYDFACFKSDRSETSGKKKALTSELTVSNTFEAIPFSSYKGITKVSSSDEELLNVEFRKVLDGSDIINFQTVLNPSKLYIGVTSDRLPAKEVSYKVETSEEADGFKGYVSQIRFQVLSWDVTIKDTGKFKTSGQSDIVLFSTVYSGTFEISGLEQLIGQEMSMDKLVYSGELVAKKTGEFKNFLQMDKVQGATTENFGLIDTQFNYWPFILSAQIKTPLWNIDHYGFNVTAGPKKSQDNGYKFKVWVASPNKQSSLKFWHTCNMQKTWFSVRSQAVLKSDHIPSLGSDQIESNIVMTGSAIDNHTTSFNLTTPFKKLQLVQVDFKHSGKNQNGNVVMKIKGRQETVLTFNRTVETTADETRVGEATFALSFIAPEFTGWTKIVFKGNAVVGNDYLWGFELTMDDQPLAVVDLLCINSGKSYPHLSRLSVSSANLGLEVKVPSMVPRFYLLRSGNSEAEQWKMYYKGEGEDKVQTTVEVTNGKVTSGTGEAFGKSITFSSSSEGVIDVKAGSTDGTNTITWQGNMEDGKLRYFNLKFSVGSQESCIDYKKEEQKMDIKYGSCSTPNTFTMDYTVSNFWDVKNMVLQLNAEHKTFPNSNQELYLLPGFSIPLTKANQNDFKTFMDIDNTQMKGNMSFESTGMGGAWFSQVHDLSNFPRAMKFKRIMRSSEPAPGRTVSSCIINYDIDAKTVDVSLDTMGMAKFILNNKQVSIEAPGYVTAGVAYSKDESTGKRMIEMNGEWGPEAGQQQCVLRLWRTDITGGVQYAVQFVDHAGKEISVVSDVTNLKITTTEFSMDAETRLTSSLIENLRSAVSKIKISFLKDETNDNYTLNYTESFTAGGEMIYDLESLFKGRLRRFPSTLRIAFLRGYLESEFSYDFSPEYSGDSYLRWSLNKVGEFRKSYLAEYRTKESSVHGGKWRDFSVEYSSPRRQFYLSESCKQLENGTIQTEVQAYLNKRNSEGIMAVFSKDFTQPDVYKRSLQLTLPTRKVGYDRVLTVDGGKLGYNITVFWDMHSDLEKKVTIQFNREKERRLSGYYYYHKMDMTAPFLKNKISKEVMYETKENEFQFSLIHTQESADKVTLNVNGKKYWDNERSAYQKEVNISFAQQKGDVKADMRITVESTKLSRSKTYTPGKFMTVFNIYTVVPSQSVDSHVRIRSVPFEEFTYACNHGATFSFRYYKGYARSRLSLFVSNSKKEAGQLTVVRDWLMSTWEATLDTGKGYMDPKSKLSFPFYEPTTVMVKASAGLSRSGKKVYFGILNGAMSVKDSISLWKPETVPAELDFFFVGIKLRKDNTMNYMSHWRISEMTKKSPFTYAKEVLIDPWAKARNLPLSFETINKLMKPVAQSQADNINTDAVLDIVNSISSTDMDSLSRWAAKAKENNEFLSSTIGKTLITAFYLAKGGVESWVESVRSLPYRDALPSDLGILSGISKLADAASRALDRVPVSSLWSSALTSMKYGSRYISSYFSNFVDTLDRKLSEKISTLTGGEGSSILDMVYSAVSSVYPVKMMCEKFSKVTEVYAEALWTADMEMASQVAKALEPYIVNTLAEIPKVYDFLDNLNYEINRWGVYFRSFFKAAVKDSADMVDNSNPLQTTYNKNVASSLELLLRGDYSGAIRKFFNTQANVINTWRVTCDQDCIDSGSFAAINGTLYLPFDVVTTFSSFSTQSGMSRGPGSYRNRYKFGGRKLNDALSELQSDQSIGGLLKRLLSPKHRTAEVREGFIKTFGGKELSNLSPCRYLLAHDFLSGDFSVYQTYTWNGGRQRGDLLVRFFKLKATITSTNELKMDGAPVTLPFVSTVDEKTMDAKRKGDVILVKFHAELLNALVVKCSLSQNSCSVRVHPLYHARVNGAFGSNDGNSANDLHANSQSDHMRLWTVDSCIMS